jgi:hypothetical protein
LAEASGLIVILVLMLARSAFAGDNFVAKLSGDEKVPPRGTKPWAWRSSSSATTVRR